MSVFDLFCIGIAFISMFTAEFFMIGLYYALKNRGTDLVLICSVGSLAPALSSIVLFVSVLSK